ncbi:MAG: sigma-70 family RNA polymerase sigma factor [Planctomycetes bacterium]|nr:sigma-70 family RNA polymerase sigma factor [Planctomycetota bacterium]
MDPIAQPPGPSERSAAEPLPPGALGDDEADARLAAAGDRGAFDRLVLRHQDAVVNAAVYHLGNREDGVDAAQEAFLRAFQAIRSFRGGCAFRTWLLTITINAARSYRTRRRALKRGGGRPGFSADRARDPGERPYEIADPDTSSSPPRLLERKEVKEALERAIAELEDDAREIVVLRDLSGESYEDIAAALGLPIGTVKSRLHRARLELRGKVARFL